MKPSPHRTKIREVSVSAMSIPPMAGKIIREPCQSMEFNATALNICLGSINEGKIDDLAGKSKPCTSPSSPEMRRTCQTRTSPVASSAANRSISTVDIPVVKISIVRRLTRSATRPPIRVARMFGTAVAAPSRPRSSGELLSSKTSHAMAMK